MDSTPNAHEHLAKATELVISIHQTLKDPTDNQTNVHQLKIIPQTSNLLAIIGQLVGKLQTLEGELIQYKNSNEIGCVLDKEESEFETVKKKLVDETNSRVEESTSQLQRSEKFVLEEATMVKQNNDLSKWKYTKLQDIIDTSCDIELLQAALDEFHRRKKVYNTWKSKHQTTKEESHLTDTDPYEEIKNPQDISCAMDRYFRIPFVRPGGKEERRGWWYAHFHGQYAARQMEVHPDKPPILLTADIDSMQMCELSLEETGLTRKRGAEILEPEFLAEWGRHGGPDFISPTQRAK